MSEGPHLVEYARSSSGHCDSSAPCKGAIIEKGQLRYGRVHRTEYETSAIQWRHWTCVTPHMLAEIAGYGYTRLPKWESLKPQDQKRVTTAIACRNANPAPTPTPVPKPQTYAAAVTAPAVTNKRKVEFDASVFTSSSSHGAGTGQSFSQVGSQEPVEEEVTEELYTTMNTKIVGIQYYTGLVGRFEEVILVREPHNKYDKNAIQVKNASRVQIGHIPRDVAIHLAPLLDRKLVTVEGVMHEGNIGVTHKLYNLSMSLKIYGDVKMRARLEPQLLWATPGRRGFPARPATAPSYSSQSAASNYVNPYSSQGQAQLLAQERSRQVQAKAQAQAHAQAQARINEERLSAFRRAEELREMLLTMEKVDDENRRSSLLDNVCSKDDVLNLPVHPKPPSVATGELRNDLLRHQSQALQWCIERENPVLPQSELEKPVQFWKLQNTGGKRYYYNIATKTPLSTNSKPVLGRGAICADAMGLGKTMTMLSLIVATKSSPSGPDVAPATLIVAPVSVLSNWTKQIEDHCTPGTLSVYTYHGDSRSITAQELQQYDVVITTFNTVANENVDTTSGSQPPAKKRKTGNVLFDIHWKRVILDEGHTIRNPRTKMAKAVCALTAERRWVLSGTPIINSPNDLGSLLAFLRICHPLNDPDYFKRLLLRPLKAGEPAGADLLRALMSHVCIRRTKEMQDSEGRPLVPLPPVDYTVVRVTLHPAAQALYEELEVLSKERIETLMDGNRAAVQSNMLSMLTRMRQAVLHPALVPNSYLEQLRAPISPENSSPATPITGEERARLQSLLSKLIEDCEECPVCLSPLEDPRITPCAHAFCLACITGCLAKDLKCPMDRRYLDLNQLVEPPAPTEFTQRPPPMDEEDEEDTESPPSAKVEQLIKLLQLAPSGDKSLVFSQFTSFLDKIEEGLNEAGIPFVRFDGQMSAKRREAAIKRFSIPVSANSAMAAEEPSHTPSTSRPARKTRTSLPLAFPLSTGTLMTEEEPATSRRTRRTRSSTASVVPVDDGGADSGDEFVPDQIDSDDDYNMAETAPRSKGKGRGKAISIPREEIEELQEHGHDGANPRVMLISLKAGALGLNLTVANNVFLMDPWWQEGIESQAIDRCNRIGQKKPVHVYQLIAENTVEAKVLDIQDRKKKLVQEAFSGNHRKETVREKKEARLQELIDLFGVRTNAAQVDAEN